MNVTRFTARNSREALKKVKDALGPDALVLANRPCADGIEIIAAPASLLSAIEVPPAHATAAMPAAAAPAPQPPAAATDSDPLRRAARPALPEQPMSTVSFQDYVRQRLRDRQQGIVEPEDPAVYAINPLQASAQPSHPLPHAATQPQHAAATPPGHALHAAPLSLDTLPELAGEADPVAAPRQPLRNAAGVAADPAAQPASTAAPVAAATAAVVASDALVNELQALKTMITQQFASISWFESVRRSPTQGRLLRALTAAGFSLKLARAVVARLPADFSESQADRWLEETLARNLRCSSADAFDAGGVFALVGPTGVGKTTSTAKIAARHVLKHGPQSVGLITVDTYRLGAHEQLRAFGKILNVPVHVAHDAGALEDLLQLLSSRQLVLIDTVGMSQRDERIGSLLAMIPRSGVRNIVVASAAVQGEALDETLRAYQARDAEGVILTKVDEAARLGGALDCLLRQRLQLLGVCNGQRVPEDWQSPESGSLVRRALLERSVGAFALDDEELSTVFGLAAARDSGIARA